MIDKKTILIRVKKELFEKYQSIIISEGTDVSFDINNHIKNQICEYRKLQVNEYFDNMEYIMVEVDISYSLYNEYKKELTLKQTTPSADIISYIQYRVVNSDKIDVIENNNRDLINAKNKVIEGEKVHTDFKFDFKLLDERVSEVYGSDRFNMYGLLNTNTNCENSILAYQIFNGMFWYDKNIDNELEPNLMYNPEDIQKMLLESYDNKYYALNFKHWIKYYKKLDYEDITPDDEKLLRYEWLLLKSTKEYYNYIFSNYDFNEFLENSGKLGNMWIIPKIVASEIKPKKYNNCPSDTFYYGMIDDDWLLEEKYDKMYDDFNGIRHFDFESFDEFYFLDGLDISTYNDECENFNYEIMLERLKYINEFINKRTNIIFDCYKASTEEK